MLREIYSCQDIVALNSVSFLTSTASAVYGLDPPPIH
jgi:hypothetical protein